MNRSESIAKLSEALAKAQGVMDASKKTSTNPFFKSSYADLSAVWDACRKPLTDNGLCVVQTADFIPEHPDMVCIETTLCHSSGEWVQGRLAVKPVKADPQSVGSCITYLRRYSLQSMVGIAPEDDDGNAASGQGAKTPTAAKKVETKQHPTPAEDVPGDYSEFPKPELPKPAATGQVTQIQIIMKNRGITERDKILEDLTGFFNRPIHSSKELTYDEAHDFVTANIEHNR